MDGASSACTHNAETVHSNRARVAQGPMDEPLVGGDPRLSPETKAILLEMVADNEFAAFLDEFCSDGLLDPIN